MKRRRGRAGPVQKQHENSQAATYPVLRRGFMPGY